MSYQLRVVPKRKRRGLHNNDAIHVLDRNQDERNGDRNVPATVALGDSSCNAACALDAISSIATYPKGSVLFVEGQRPVGVFLLRSGRVRLATGSADGKSLIVRIAEPEEVMGLAGAISGRAHELTAEALETVECGFISRETFLQFLRESSSEALLMAEILSNIYAATLNQVRYLGLSASTAEKVARLLLERHAEQSNGHSQGAALTHKEIAEMIGSSRETVTRTLARFRRDNLVKVNGRGLQVLDRAGLERFLTG